MIVLAVREPFRKTTGWARRARVQDGRKAVIKWYRPPDKEVGCFSPR
jgi:hypothetical protein